jgi:WD40 repeat protein
VRLLPVLLLLCVSARSQGVYSDFGQNTTQRNKVEYSLTHDQIEIIYYKDGENLAKLVLEKAIQYIPEYESRLNYNLSNGIKITVFNNFDDFRKSNINITNPQYYAGGYSSLNDNSSTVYFDGSRVNFDKQVRKAVAEVLINEFIFGGNIRERIQTSALLTLPDWYYKGLVAYLAESWNIQNDNFLKDFFQTKKHKYFTSLQSEDEILAGHSIWRYLEEKNGKSAVSNIVFLTRIGRSVENAVIYYTGLNINNLLNDWQDFYIEKYKNDELAFKFPKGQENAPVKLAKKRHTQFKLSGDGKKIAIVTNTLGRYQIVLYGIAGKNVNVIARGGHQLLNRDLDYNYPLIAWNPDGKTLSVIYYEEGQTLHKSYQMDGKLLKTEVLANIPFVKDFNYSPDGNSIIFSVIRNGQSDLVLYNISSKSAEVLSNDIFDDLNPRFSQDGKSVYYVSNRHYSKPSETAYYGIFKLDIEDRSSQFLIGKQDEKINITQPIELSNGLISYLSDENGIINNFVYDKADGQSYQLTNYKRCIISNDVASQVPIVADLLFFNNRYRIYVGNITEDYKSEAITDAGSTAYRKLMLYQDVPASRDTVKMNKPDSLSGKGSSKNPGKPAGRVYLSGFDEKDDLERASQASDNKNEPFMSIARTNFGLNYFLQQFDNSILNSYLFPTGISEIIFNYPLMSPHIQTSISDVQKNHVITAGIRVPITIKASDYYIHYANRKGRWDMEYSAFRRGRIIDNELVPVRMINAQGKISFIYPFNERSRFEINFLGRNDRVISQAIDSIEISRPAKDNKYFGNGFEYVFDNVRSNGLNLFQGLRVKAYNENYHRIEGKYQFISNTGIDARYYKKLHRQIYLATRLSGAVSAGTQTTAYYLGGVENWIIAARSSNNFNYNIPTLSGDEYAFQTIVSPQRGFLRNSRGGNKYVLLNTELRVPLFAYLFQKPISSEFFKSVMLIGFIDIGTAWKGSSPYSIENPFNTTIVSSSQYTVTVVTQRDPFLYAFGIGARARILGHYVKVDRGYGFTENKLRKGMTTFSIGLDF